MPRTQSLARDFDPAFDHLTEVTGFGSNPGALRMFEYVPADPQPALVVVLHGCMQKAASYDFGAGWSTLADRHGFVLLLPEQQRANNAKNCFNWFCAGFGRLLHRQRYYFRAFADVLSVGDEEYYDHDADDVENIHYVLRLRHA
jgi:hypothetical protein